jgi:hypothetical protein
MGDERFSGVVFTKENRGIRKIQDINHRSRVKNDRVKETNPGVKKQ